MRPKYPKKINRVIFAFFSRNFGNKENILKSFVWCLSDGKELNFPSLKNANYNTSKRKPSQGGYQHLNPVVGFRMLVAL